MDVTERPKKKIQSSIPELSVGEERKLFNQIRKSAAYITPDTLLFNGWTAGGFALTYIIQHHMKRKRKAEEKTEPGAPKRAKTKAFEDPVTITSLEEKVEEKPKPKKRAKKSVPSPLELERQTCDSHEMLEFVEVTNLSSPTPVETPTVKTPKRKAAPKNVVEPKEKVGKETIKEIEKKPRAPRAPRKQKEKI